MDAFYEEIQADIGGALHDIGATFITHTRTGEGWNETDVCFFSASDKLIAISHAPRDGFTCFIVTRDPRNYRNTKRGIRCGTASAWTKNIDAEGGLEEYIRMFPSDHEEYMKFMGTCLMKYFGHVQ